MMTRQLTATLALVTLFLACTKEPAIIEQPIVEDPIVENPVDTTSVIDPGVDTSIYLPASVFVADTGTYAAILSSSTYSGLQYWLDKKRLVIINDTLRLGYYTLLPISATSAHILPFLTSIQKSTSNGYTYNVEARGTGVISVNGDQLIASIHKIAIDSSSSSNSLHTYYNSNSSPLPPSRDDYVGQYFGYVENASGNGNSITMTLEAISGTSDGIWVKEINRNAIVNTNGDLIIPESAADSTVYGPNTVYLIAQTRLNGKVLQFGQILSQQGYTIINSRKYYGLIKQ